MAGGRACPGGMHDWGGMPGGACIAGGHVWLGGMRGWGVCMAEAQLKNGSLPSTGNRKKRYFTVYRKQRKTEVDCLPETEKKFHLIMMIVTHLIGALFSDVYFHSFNILIFPRSSLYWRPNGQVQLTYR